MASVGGFLKGLWGFIYKCVAWIASIAGSLSPDRRFKVDETLVYSVHPSFYLWPLILVGWVTSFAIRHYPNHVAGWTWLYLWLMFYTFIMLVFDIGTIKLVACTVVFLLFWMTARYIEAARNVVLLGHIFAHFRELHPTISGGFASIISWMLFVPWAVMLVESYRSGRKSFSPNGIEERSILVGREITDRTGLHFKCYYPDLLETIFGCGSGSIVAYDANNKVVKEWHNIVFLWFKWMRLDEILHQRSAVVDNAPNDPVEVETREEEIKATKAGS